MPVGFGLLPQIGVAAVFALIALLVLIKGRHTATGYPAVAAIGVAAVLGASWSVSRLRAEAFDPTVALVAYELVLLAVAVAFPLAAQAVIRSWAKLADRMLAGERLAGLEGFAVVLGRVLSDASVQVFRWHDADAGYVDERGRSVPTGGTPPTCPAKTGTSFCRISPAQCFVCWSHGVPTRATCSPR